MIAVRFLHHACACCGKVFDRPRLNKRACSSKCRGKLHRLDLANDLTLRERMELFASVATDEQWEAFEAFARLASWDDWNAFAVNVRLADERDDVPRETVDDPGHPQELLVDDER